MTRAEKMPCFQVLLYLPAVSVSQALPIPAQLEIQQSHGFQKRLAVMTTKLLIKTEASVHLGGTETIFFSLSNKQYAFPFFLISFRDDRSLDFTLEHWQWNLRR